MTLQCREILNLLRDMQRQMKVTSLVIKNFLIPTFLLIRFKLQIYSIQVLVNIL